MKRTIIYLIAVAALAAQATEIHQRPAHVLSLQFHGDTLFVHRPPLESAKYRYGESGSSSGNSTPLAPPFGRRTLFLLSGLLIPPGLYFGGKLIDRHRNGVGVGIIIGSYVPFTVSLFLISVNGFPWSWGWWL